MLRSALFLAGRDARNMLRHRETLLWVFIMPVIFFYFIGTVTGGFAGSAGPETIALSAPSNAGFLAERLAARLEQRGYKVTRPPSEEQFARSRRRLRLPTGFTDSVLAGKPVKVELERTGGGNDASYDEIRVARAVYSLLADLIVSEKGGRPPTPEALDELTRQPRSLSVEVVPAGRRKKIPTGFEQAVPGTMVMFTLFVLFTNGGVSLVIERREGLLRRLASSPMSRGAVVLGKWGARMALGAVQIAFAMLTGRLLFGVDWGPHLGVLLVVLLVYGALGTALGILLGNFGRSEGQVAAMGVISTNILAALGGCWWPIEITPRWAQTLALFLPTGVAMDAVHRLVSFQSAPSAVIPHIVGMTLAAVVAGAVVARTFRFQ
jgi:ABC-type Na+ efflux pump permease subunit